MNVSPAALTFGAVAATLLACLIFRAIARLLGQPAVVGELFGGVLLGPTLLGSFSATVLPDVVRPQLSTLGNIGAALFMLVLGLEFGAGKHSGQIRHAGLIGIGSVALPFALGAGFGGLLAAWGRAPVNPTVFVLFMGIAMAVTAFPVLAKLLEHRKLTDTDIGRLAIGAAATSDAVAWTVLALVISIARAGVQTFWMTVVVVPLYLLLRHGIAPALRALLARHPAAARSPGGLTAGLIAGAFASGAVTEMIGLHFIFGAFIFGVVMAPSIPLEPSALPLRPITGVAALFLPVYFLSAGLRVDLSLSLPVAGLTVLALSVAVSGKVGGTFISARLVGLPKEQAGVLAVLMNTRGLTELVVLTTGLELGILSAELYSIMVLVALVTTAATNPVLTVLDRRNRRVSQRTTSPP